MQRRQISWLQKELRDLCVAWKPGFRILGQLAATLTTPVRVL